MVILTATEITAQLKKRNSWAHSSSDAIRAPASRVKVKCPRLIQEMQRGEAVAKCHRGAAGDVE
jgi:hypothetical protein